ncbi:hydrogen peroxide-inducible genes activator [Jejuia pallidilutea]|uniref:Hydrogen peroxide-inducible genes activator n=1 Tax=Jejuia pallidilutea TaxID=504487 RepID=A0A090W6N3_9FLAO|nr:hydrogen peroxide-inducible genes activator [Jejuia pallidilutea]
MYFEPFVAYIPKGHKLHTKNKIKTDELVIEDMLLLEDGHCFRDGVINLCKAFKNHEEDKFQLESGSIETLIKLSNEGLGMTLLPYLHTLDLNTSAKENLHYFEEPAPAREVSIIYHKSELKMQIIEAMQSVISGIIRGAIKFQDVKIISLYPNKKRP